MRSTKWLPVFLLSFSLLSIPRSFSENAVSETEGNTAYDIIKCADDLMRGETIQGKSEFIVITPKWTRKRVLQQWSVGYDKFFVRIIDPEIERGTGSLKIGYDFWHYLASAERTIKIAPSMMLQAWFGSDFTNDDLVKMSSISRDYVQEIIGEEEIEGTLAYKIRLTPRSEAPVVWGELIAWIRKEGCAPLKVEYYSEDKELVRILHYSETKQVDDRVIPTVMTMQWTDQPGRKSILRIIEAKFNQAIPDRIFAIENLESYGEE